MNAHPQNRLMLDNFIKTINQYFKANTSSLRDISVQNKEITLIKKGIEIFTKFFTQEQKDDFMRKIDSNLQYLNGINHYKDTKNKEEIIGYLDKYVCKLSLKNGLKIFIGRDAYLIYLFYKRQARKKGNDDYSFLRYSRPYLFGNSNGEGYFKLIELLYKNKFKEDKYSQFLTNFKNNLKNENGFYENIRNKTLHMIKTEKVIQKLNQYKKFTVVDSGIQAGLALPMSIVLEEEGYKGSFSLFSCYKWVHRLFINKVFTDNLFILDKLEHESLKSFNQNFGN
ncbi:MAG: hypothetical protein UT63_C0011G0013 [Candidatus Gottesmanbacteria bacterium GW2011_GWC2_39_8]|uniref:Uncharacterized protein n=1 Tax=Candidatus Gottesmanbacteria bacterium GW2011_GWC2_39_8 TaxID=1618450 RepID=A0A0G0Q922_9BACT|nr:MAG: hypothetical protein UT63_C0011G0013 [Candidatus Gottesmanbacteria bacterium GW2011_GWC2_39_8]